MWSVATYQPLKQVIHMLINALLCNRNIYKRGQMKKLVSLTVIITSKKSHFPLKPGIAFSLQSSHRKHQPQINIQKVHHLIIVYNSTWKVCVNSLLSFSHRQTFWSCSGSHGYELKGAVRQTAGWRQDFYIQQKFKWGVYSQFLWFESKSRLSELTRVINLRTYCCDTYRLCILHCQNDFQ